MFIDDAAHNLNMTSQINQEANSFNTFHTTHSHFFGININFFIIIAFNKIKADI